MRKIFLSSLALCVFSFGFAQNDTMGRVAGPREVPANDHFVIQVGALSWQGRPDSIRTGGLPRTFNMYVMLDFPFKTNPHFSVAIGPGIATDNMFLDKTHVTITDNAGALHFVDRKDTTHFKKYKLSTAYLEAPVELRYAFNPDRNANSVKIVVGAKVGTLLSAWTKGKTLEDRNGNALNAFTEKEKSKRFFNSTRLSLTGRLGYGHFSVFGSYALTPLFKEGAGPKVQPMSIGLTLSGL